MSRQQILERKQAITVRQIEDRWGISQRTIYRYIQQGRLKPFRVGPRLIRFDADEVEQALVGER